MALFCICQISKMSQKAKKKKEKIQISHFFRQLTIKKLVIVTERLTMTKHKQKDGNDLLSKFFYYENRKLDDGLGEMESVN